MKKYFLLAIGSLLVATFSFAQTSTTEHFESETDENTTFVDNGVIFSIVSNTGRFFIQTSYPNTGWNGTANDNAYIDNSGSLSLFDPNAVLNSSLSIKTTSNLFKVNRFWVYLATADAAVQNVVGTLTVTGKSRGVNSFTQTKTTGFVTSTDTTNGYTLIDLTNLNGQNYAGIVIDELQLTVGGAYRYMAVDAFNWVKEAAVLPVTFGSVNASSKNNRLSISWTTEKENSNDHFEIEASTDGQQFTKIGIIASQAANGNSDIVLSYQWTSNSALPLAGFSLVGLILMPFSNLSRKKTWVLGLAAVGFTAFVLHGCTKSGDAIDDHQPYYVRIAQVDKDGTKSYSKVVKVQQDQ
ncbi:hypothetical protein U0035_02480 [Niabella yanshanensis]|uniref:Exo-alpha-sialidase n=1 Tax=Niabella yanshanensis TaxID=577386 RepID=A0ABZ0W932_9BACT|nr:hypothetical protein [Niabella yanshanensis]WQD39012.1 hypothetical protein U0035_02480 [Niabella yanshanensis]